MDFNCIICGILFTCNEEGKSCYLEGYIGYLNRYLKKEIEMGKNKVCKKCNRALLDFLGDNLISKIMNYEVIEMEKKLQRKLKELSKVTQSALNKLERIREKLNIRDINEAGLFLQGTDQACEATRGDLAKMEEKQKCFEDWSKMDNFSEKSTLRITSVASLATSDDAFEKSEVFQVKIEKEAEPEESYPSFEEPFLERVVKLEVEPVRKTRRGTIFTTKELPDPGEVCMLPEVANETSESELIDLEVERENPGTSGIHKNEVKGNNKRSIPEAVDEDRPLKVLRFSEPLTTENSLFNQKSNLEEEWILEVNCFLDNKNWTKLHNHLLKMPKLNPETFHKLIISLHFANQLGLSPSGMEPLLIQAISNGIEVKEKTIEILSRAKINFNKVDEKSRNILFLAIKHNLGVSVLRNLIEKGANAKQVDIHGQNLLHRAAAHGSAPEVIKFLIMREVKINKEDGGGETPVFKLKYVTDLERKLSLFKELANSGGNIYKKNLNGETPLHVCFGGEIPPQEFQKIVEFLAEKKSMSLFNVGDNSKRTPFHLFLKSFEIDKETLKLLATAGVKFTFVDENGNGVLHYAIEGNRSPEVLLGLVENGASPKIINRFRQTLLHFAIKNKSPLPTFQFLLERADITEVNGDGETVLHCALSHREKLSEDVLTKLFISTVNAGISRLEEWDEPILQTVSKYGSPEALRKTLEKIKKVNEKAPDGMTAFLCACQSWRPSQAVEKAKILRAHGAEVKARTKNGMTALHHAALQGSKDILKYLLELGLDLEATDMFGNTPLITILTNFSFENEVQVEKAKYLLKKGANANAKNKKLEIPLHLALKAYKTPSESSMEFLKLLLKTGADVNAKGEHGWTSVHVAVNCPEQVSLQLLNFLIESGANTNARTGPDKTILHFAVEKASLRIIRFCLEKGLSLNSWGCGIGSPIHLFLQKLPSAFIRGKLQPEDCVKTMKLLLGATRASQSTRNDLRNVIQVILKKIESSARFSPLVEVYKKIDQLLTVKVKIVSEKYKTN